jgi:hypothetical protein
MGAAVMIIGTGTGTVPEGVVVVAEGDVIGVIVGRVEGNCVVWKIGDDDITGVLDEGMTGAVAGEFVTGGVFGASMTGALAGDVVVGEGIGAGAIGARTGIVIVVGGVIGIGKLGVVVDEVGF